MIGELKLMTRIDSAGQVIIMVMFNSVIAGRLTMSEEDYAMFKRHIITFKEVA